MAMEIRKAIPDDALGITIVSAYTWKTTYEGIVPDAVIDERINGLPERAKRQKAELEKGEKCVVATVDDTVIGFCRYGSSRDARFPDSGEIYALYVLRGYQGQNIGKALFFFGTRELFAEGKTSMIINCLRGNPAIGFYGRMGGERVGERRDALTGGEILEDIMFFGELSAVIQSDAGRTDVARSKKE